MRKKRRRTPRPAPPRRSQKLVSKVKAKKLSQGDEGGESDGKGAVDAIARAKAKAEEAKAKKRVTKVKLGVPSKLRDSKKTSEEVPASAPAAPQSSKLKRASAKNVKRVKLGSGAKGELDSASDNATETGVRRVSSKHRRRNIGGHKRDDSRLRDAAASQIKAQRKNDSDDEMQELTLAIGDAADYDAEFAEQDASGTFSLSVELADDEVEYEDEEEEISTSSQLGGALQRALKKRPLIQPQQSGGFGNGFPKTNCRPCLRKHTNIWWKASLQLAVQLLSDIIDLEEHFLLAYVARGRIFLDLGDYARAMSDFTIAHEASPELPEPRSRSGIFIFHERIMRGPFNFSMVRCLSCPIMRWLTADVASVIITNETMSGHSQI